MKNIHDAESLMRLLAESKLVDLKSTPEAGSKELDALRDKLVQSASNGDIGGLVEVLENASSLLSEALNPTEDSKNE